MASQQKRRGFKSGFWPALAASMTFALGRARLDHADELRSFWYYLGARCPIWPRRSHQISIFVGMMRKGNVLSAACASRALRSVMSRTQSPQCGDFKMHSISHLSGFPRYFIDFVALVKREESTLSDMNGFSCRCITKLPIMTRLSGATMLLFMVDSRAPLLAPDITDARDEELRWIIELPELIRRTLATLGEFEDNGLIHETSALLSCTSVSSRCHSLTLSVGRWKRRAESRRAGRGRRNCRHPHCQQALFGTW